MRPTPAFGFAAGTPSLHILHFVPLNPLDSPSPPATKAAMPILLTILILGIVEGVTEFIPVSSTGHLILASALLGYDEKQWAVFNVVIQLGAILAVVVLYWRTFWAVLIGLMARQPESWRFLRNILVAFMPSAVVGADPPESSAAKSTPRM